MTHDPYEETNRQYAATEKALADRDALIRELVAVLWSIQIDEDESRTTTKLLAGQALAKAKAAGYSV
jgi:hypothetical protein